MQVSREGFLHALELTQPGLAKREIVEQSSCYAFSGGEVYSFNGEVCCHCPSGLDEDFSGSVPAQPLLDLLHKWKDNEVDIELGEGELLLHGAKANGVRAKRHAGIRMEADIALPIDMVEQPEEWQPLHGDFCEAVGLVGRCAGKDESQHYLTCVNVTPAYVEACDNYQLCRWNLETGLAGSIQVKQSAIRHIATASMTEFAETECWLHFRNADGLVISCRRYLEDYPKMGDFLQFDGQPIVLTKGLVEAIDNAQVFSKENVEGDRILLSLKPGKAILWGEGIKGWCKEEKPLKQYSGPPLKFYAIPVILSDFIARHADQANRHFTVSVERLRVEAGAYTYCMVLFAPEERRPEEVVTELRPEQLQPPHEVQGNGETISDRKKRKARKTEEA